MNILLLEDDLNRVKKFRAEYPSIQHCDNVDDIINLFNKIEDIEILFLDHDLGGEQMVDSSHYNTGTTVAKWLVDNPKNINTIVVHSLNPVGRKSMVDILSPVYPTVLSVPYLSLHFIK